MYIFTMHSLSSTPCTVLTFVPAKMLVTRLNGQDYKFYSNYMNVPALLCTY